MMIKINHHFLASKLFPIPSTAELFHSLRAVLSPHQVFPSQRSVTLRLVTSISFLHDLLRPKAHSVTHHEERRIEEYCYAGGANKLPYFQKKIFYVLVCSTDSQ